jgi:cytochrome b subunit of formate dehydrogenase
MASLLCRSIVLIVLILPRWSAAQDNQDCLECHADEDIEAETTRGKSLDLKVEEKVLVGSVHEDLKCTDCHGGELTWEEAPHNLGKSLTLRCDKCHEQEAKEYNQACIHGKVYKEKHPRAPWCHDCHGGHRILSLASEKSALTPLNQPATCGKCHGSDALSPRNGIAKRRLLERYYSSVHWQSVKEGKPAASCSNCHGSHHILPSSDRESHVSRIGLLSACAQCHQAVVQIYSKGSHGRTLLHGNLDVPTCTTCHGDHDMMSLKTQVGGTRNFAGTQICIWCHGNVRMMARYALDTSPVESYMKDFHGLTQRGTAGTSATCADCHDAHHSLPESHPESRMHISNRGSACGKCHGKTSDSFIMSFTHRTVAVDHGGGIKRIIIIIYLVLILAIIGGMLIHNGIIWLHSFRKKYRYQKKHGKIVRLNRFEKFWHWTLLLSFFTLVFTGFALKYPESVWFRWLYSLGLTEAARATVHRLAAATMTGNMLLLLFYQVISRAGRRRWKHMRPRVTDVKDLYSNMRYHLGLMKTRPVFGIFSYMEKAEFWALVWGTLIMVITGLVLWFPKSLPDTWPSWAFDVARIIHFYEAILASLAVLVWHFFHTIFRPGEYPMDTSWLTGVLTEKEAGHRFTREALEAQILPPAQEDEPEEPEAPEWEGEEPGKRRDDDDRK